jgi:hypothetical protein
MLPAPNDFPAHHFAYFYDKINRISENYLAYTAIFPSPRASVRALENFSKPQRHGENTKVFTQAP